MSDTSGLSSRTPLAFYDPDSSSWRTSQATFLSDSMSSSLTLPASGMTRSGVLYELPTSGPVTAELVSSCLPTPRSTRGGSATETLYALGAGRSDEDRPQGEVLLPTPVAQDDGKSPEAHMAMKQRMAGGPRDQITSLSVMARQAGTTGRWDAALLPTPMGKDGKGQPLPREDGDDLVTAVDKLLPTPTNRDHKGSRGAPRETYNHGNGPDSLPDAVGPLLPTPTTQPATGNGHARNLGKEARMLPTPSAADGLGGHERRGGKRGDELLLAGLAKDVTRMLPTPMGADAERGSKFARPTRPGSEGDNLPDALAKLSGEPTDPPSPATPSSPADQLRIPWTDGEG